MASIESRATTYFLGGMTLSPQSHRFTNHRTKRAVVSLNRRRRFDAASSSSSSSSMEGVSRFALSPTTSLVIQRGDITKWSIDGSSDALVNPADELMLGGGGADGAIREAAGPDLLQACQGVTEVRPGVRCPTGEARITPGFKLPVAHVIFTVGPIYDSEGDPEASLRSAYRYPHEEAATIALSTVKEFADEIKEVHFVLFHEDIYFVWLNKATNFFTLDEQSVDQV